MSLLVDDEDHEDPDSVSALELDQISSCIWRWQRHSPHHKIDLSSHAVGMGSRLYIFDPIRLPSSKLKELIKDFREPIIVLTNGNHERSAGWWSREANAPIFRPEGPCTSMRTTQLPTGKSTWLDWQLHPLPGGAPGETAFQHGNLMVFGDAVVNLPGRPPCILPPKYCQNFPALVKQLLALSELEIGAALMSHGNPWMVDAGSHIRTLCHQVVE